MATEPRRWSPRLAELRDGAEAAARRQDEALERVDRLLRSAQQALRDGRIESALIYLSDARAESNAARADAKEIVNLMREAQKGRP